MITNLILGSNQFVYPFYLETVKASGDRVGKGVRLDNDRGSSLEDGGRGRDDGGSLDDGGRANKGSLGSLGFEVVGTGGSYRGCVIGHNVAKDVLQVE